MGDCPFCERIARAEYDWRERVDGHSIVGFEPLNPVTPGHLLIVPVRHVSDALIDPMLTGYVMEMAARKAPISGAFNLITSAGPAASQSVFHLHVHVVPRRPGDGLALPWTGQVRAAAPAEEKR